MPNIRNINAAYTVARVKVTEDGRHDVLMHELRGSHGHIAWEVLSQEVYQIFVDEDYRRQGYATKLWRLAESIAPIKHSRWRTDSGDAFARSFGVPLPEREIA